MKTFRGIEKVDDVSLATKTRNAYDVNKCPKCAYNNALGECEIEGECFYIPRFKVDCIAKIKAMGTKLTDGQLQNTTIQGLKEMYIKMVKEGKKEK